MIEQQIEWDEETNKCALVTRHNKDMVSSVPLTPQEAAEWTAENKF